MVRGKRRRDEGKTRKAASRFPRTYRFPRRYNNRWCLTLPRRAKPSFLSLACSRHATAHLVLLSSNGTLTFAKLLPRSHGTTILPRCSILASILPPLLSVTKLFSLSLGLDSISSLDLDDVVLAHLHLKIAEATANKHTYTRG